MKIHTKKNDLIIVSVLFLSLIVAGVNQTYISDEAPLKVPNSAANPIINPGEYYSITNSAQGYDYLDWEFLGTENIPLIAYILNASEFLNYDASLPFVAAYETDGTTYEEYGSFTVPYTDVWYFVVENPLSNSVSSTLDIITFDLVENTDFNGVLTLTNSHVMNSTSAMGGDSIDWNYEGSNYDVSIFPILMDDIQYNQFILGNPYTYYNLAESAWDNNFGSFIVPYTAIWYLIYLNNDTQGQATDIVDSFTLISMDFGGTFIDYNSWKNFQNFSACGYDDIYWQYEGSNPDVALYPIIMDAEEFVQFELGNPARYYDLSDAAYTYDWGWFQVPYTAEWVLVIMNNDTSMQPTDVNCTTSYTPEFFGGTLLKYDHYIADFQVAKGGDDIYWEFEGTNWAVDINVQMMDSYQFTAFELGMPYSYYNITDSAYTSNWGWFYVPYTANWSIVFLNWDELSQPTDLKWNMTLQPQYFNGSLLPYLAYNATIFNASGGDNLFWEFQGTNDDIGLTAWLMDKESFVNFTLGNSYSYFHLNEWASYSCDWGYDMIPYSGEWYFILQNLDANATATDIKITLTLDPMNFEGEFLNYSEYIGYNFTVMQGNVLFYDFYGSNANVNLTLWLMDAANYTLFETDRDFFFYNISVGFTGDMGWTEFPYAGEWYLVILNLDENQQPTDFVLFTDIWEAMNENPSFENDFSDLELTLSEAQDYSFNWQISDSIVGDNCYLFIFINDEIVYNATWNPTTNITLALPNLINPLEEGEYNFEIVVFDGYDGMIYEEFSLTVVTDSGTDDDTTADDTTDDDTTDDDTTDDDTTDDDTTGDPLTSIPGFNTIGIITGLSLLIIIGKKRKLTSKVE